MNTLFSELATRHFASLVEDYGFSTQLVEQDDSLVKLQLFYSQFCRVGITQDGSQVYVDVGSLSLSALDAPQFDLYDIIHHRDPTLGFHYTFDPDGYARNPSNWLDQELERLAGLLLRYCGDMLQGDFSIASQIQLSMRRQHAAVYAPTQQHPSPSES